MRIKCKEAISESEEELARRERELRGQASQARVRMLRLLRSGAISSLSRGTELVGYSPRQMSRWEIQGVGTGGDACR